MPAAGVILMTPPISSSPSSSLPSAALPPAALPPPSAKAVLDSPRNPKGNQSVKTKILVWGIVSILIIGIAAGAYWCLRRPQIITLTDGTKLTLLGATYGAHHVPPKIKIAGQNSRGNGAQLDSAGNTLVIWIEAQHKPNDYQWQSYQLLVYDTANTACVSSWTRTQSQIKDGVDIQGFMLSAYPRWDSKMILRVMSWGNNGQHLAKEQLVVSNPRRVSAATWAAEPLPDTQSDGDLEVTLTKLVCGVRGFNGGNTSSTDPMNKAVLAAFHTVQKGVVVTNWQPVRITTSDASGNQLDNNSWSNGRDDNGDATMTYQWGLWPGQTPWKLRVEMSRTSGFNSDELWTVEKVPVKPGRQMDLYNYCGNTQTNAPFAETTLNGIHLKLYPAMQFTDQNFNGQQMGGFRIVADPPPPEGYRLTLDKATDEQGREIQGFNPSWGGGNYGFQIQNMRNAKMLNLTIALHKSRFVEYTVKPSPQ